MIIFVITKFWTKYSEYDSCGCGNIDEKDIEMFTTVEKALERLKIIREESKSSVFKSDHDGWYELRVREIE